MKKTYRKVISRTITHTLSRFIAIFAIVALGVGFLAGLLAATPDMRYSGDKYFDETNLADIRIVSSLGLSEADIQLARESEGVDEVMAGQSADLLMTGSGGDTLVVRVHGLELNKFTDNDAPDYLNRLILTGGRMPERSNECVIELGEYDTTGINIGDTITAGNDNTAIEDTLAVTSFTIVGTVKSSYYFSFEREPATVGNGSTNLIAYVDADAFSREEYSDLFLTLDGAKAMQSLSTKYYDKIDSAITDLETKYDARVQPRLAEVKAKATKTLDDAKQEYNDKKQEADEKLADARAKIADGQKEIADGEKELKDAKIKLNDGVQKLADAKEEFTQVMAMGRERIFLGSQELAQAKEQLDAKAASLPEQEAALATAKQSLAEGKKQLAEGEAGLAALQGEITKYSAILDELKAQLGSGVDEAALAAQIAATEQALTELKAKHSGLDAQLAPERAKLATAEAKLQAADTQLTEGKAALAAARVQIADSEEELAEGEAELDAAPAKAQAEFDKAQKEIDRGRRDIAKGESELADAHIKLADGEKEYNDSKLEAEIKLSDAEDKLNDADKKINELEAPEYFVLDRKANVSFASFEGNISKISAIATVFPIFFFLVAALVALTTMTRMVEEERLQIGTLKALGYSNKTIAFKYLLYAFLACSLGCVAGLLIGFNLLPRVIWNAYSMMYNLPPLICQFNIKYAIIASGVSLACTMAATINACWESLKENPATLMLPRAPKAGKRILLERLTFIWKRMKFTHKVTARNLFRYKKRFFMTVIGIAGCTALLLTGFGLRDSISGIIDKQFDDIFLYRLAISAKNEKSVNKPELQALLNNEAKVAGYMPVHQEKSTNTFGSKAVSIYLIVPQDNSELPSFIDLHERKSKKPVPLPDSGAIITEKLAARAGVGVGDIITLKNSDKRTAEFTVTGIVENYVENYVYLSNTAYTQGFAEAPVFNSVYAIPAAAPEDTAMHDSLTAELLECDGVNNVTFIDDMRVSFDDMLKNITYVVYVLIVAAGILAFVVLYNLTNINIAEREKEIATIKVLGFFDKEVSAYVYRESAVLSLIGTAVGLVLGIFLHAFVIRTAEVDAVMFGREIKVLSYIMSAGLTIFFSVLVNIVMKPKLKHISMVESMKAPE